MYIIIWWNTCELHSWLVEQLSDWVIQMMCECVIIKFQNLELDHLVN